MNYIRNFFGGWDAQKNINNPQLNKVEEEVDGFVVIDSHINEPETNFISKEFNIRNASNNIVSGIKKITSGVLDIVSCANPFNNELVNNKTQQKAGMLSDTKSIQKLIKESRSSDTETIQKLTKEIKLNYVIDDAYIRSKKGNKFAEEITKLKKENNILLGENGKLKNRKSPLDTFKKSANLCLISKNNAEILHNYICLACAKASSDDGSDKQQMQYLSNINGFAEEMAKKYENHAKNIFGEISNLENFLGKRKNLAKKDNELKAKRGSNHNAKRKSPDKKLSGKKDAMLKRPGVSNKRKNISTPKLPKEIVDNYDKPHALKNYINSKPFENESTEESSTLSDIDIDNELQKLENGINTETIKNGSIEDSNIFDDIDIDSIKYRYNEVKAENKKQIKLMNEQKKELSKLRKGHGRINKLFAQYGQNNVSDEELEELRKQL